MEEEKESWYNETINRLRQISSKLGGEDLEKQKIKQDQIQIGRNIRRLRLEKKLGQTELANKLQLEGVDMTREALVKIERGIQHISATQLKAIRDVLQTSYDELLKETP